MDIPTRQLLDMLANVEAREILLERLSLLPEAFAATVHEGALGTTMIESIFSNAAQQPGFKKVQVVPSK